MLSHYRKHAYNLNPNNSPAVYANTFYNEVTASAKPLSENEHFKGILS